jgi:hypothetical protein
MTDAEADALDEELTRTIPELGPNGEGFFSAQGRRIIAVDEDTARILNAKALATHRTPSELIAEMVREQLAAAAI